MNRCDPNPFGNAIKALQVRIGAHVLITEGMCEIPFSNWLYSRLEAEVRYTLYLDCISQGKGHRSWLSTFLNPAQGSDPWDRILSEYPVLDGRVQKLSLDIAAAMTEFALRLSTDRCRIQDTFGISCDDPVKNIETCLSDPHHGGRSVMRLYFQSGRSLIYKPKPLAIEARINTFLARHGEYFGLRALKICNMGTHGYAEDAGPSRRLDKQEFREPEKMGRVAGFFWLLNATDLHVENILLTSDGIACLDLETLFAAAWISREEGNTSWRAHSVTTTLLFDASVFAHSRVANISGFYPTPSSGSFAHNVRFSVSDDQLIASPIFPVTELDSVTYVGSSDADPKLLSELQYGFRSATSPEARAILSKFVRNLPAETPLRLVARETFFYERIRERMRQPRFLRDSSAPRHDLESLRQSVMVTGQDDALLDHLVGDEITQLLAGDIPYFGYSIDSTEIVVSDGLRLKVFGESPRSFALRKLSNVVDADIEEQLTLIAISLGFGQPRRQKCPMKVSQSIEDDLIWLARKLLSDAYIPDNSPARWITLSGDVSKKDLSVAAGGQSFFSGSLGIVLSLQAAEKVLKFPELSDFLDKEALEWADMQPPPSSVYDRPPLGFSGVGGELFATAELMRIDAKRWNFLRAGLTEKIRTARNALSQDEGLDIMSGSAGLILALVRLRGLVAEKNLSFEINETIAAAVSHLVTSATREDVGIAWHVPFEDQPLLGYAHGWSGIAAALISGSFSISSKLKTEVTGVLEDSLHFLEYDAHKYGGLVEHRSGEGVHQPLNKSWCNGVPGFLRGYLATGILGSGQLDFVVDGLFNNMLQSMGDGSACRFCCGDLGAVDFVLDLGTIRKDDQLRAKSMEAGRKIIGRAVSEAQGAVEDQKPEVAFAGLFQNLGGILYTGCRLLDPSGLVSLSGQDAKMLSTEASRAMSI